MNWGEHTVSTTRPNELERSFNKGRDQKKNGEKRVGWKEAERASEGGGKRGGFQKKVRRMSPYWG